MSGPGFSGLAFWTRAASSASASAVAAGNSRVNLALAVSGGLLAALAFPNPFYPGLDWPAGWLALVCLVPLLAVRESGTGFLASARWGFVFGAVYFGLSTVWMAFMPALGALAPGAWLLLTGYLALYPAVFLALYHRLLRRGAPAWSAAAACWLLLDFARNYILSGFPWVALGYALHRIPCALALAPVTGVWGLTAAAVLVNSALLGLLRLPWRSAAVPTAETRSGGRRLRLAGLALLIAAVVAAAVVERRAIDRSDAEPALVAAVLQGNIDQNQPWTPEYRRHTLERYWTLLSRSADQGARFALWPESAFPGIFNWDRSLAAEVKEWSRRYGLTQAVGADTLERTTGGEYLYYNSVLAVTSGGEVCDYISKIHLVPFGEYVPFKAWLHPFLRKLVLRYGAGDFSPGVRRQPLAAPAPGGLLRFGVLICFESLFPQYAADLTRQGSRLLAVSTLDTWFGRTAAPAQHAIFSVLRAAENGRDLLRAGATGISGLVDARGRWLAVIPLDREDAAVATVHLRSHLTLFTRLGPWIVWLALAVFLWDLRPRKRP